MTLKVGDKAIQIDYGHGLVLITKIEQNGNRLKIWHRHLEGRESGQSGCISCLPNEIEQYFKLAEKKKIKELGIVDFMRRTGVKI